MIIFRYSFAILLLMIFILSGQLAARTYSDPDLGFSMTISDHFSLTSEEEGAFYFTLADSSAVVIVKNWPGLQEDDVREAGMNGYQDEGIALVVRGRSDQQPIRNGWRLLVDVEGRVEGNRVKGILGGYVGKQGQGFIILLASVPDKWLQIRPEMEAVLNSIVFTRFSGGEEVSHWRRYLAGKKLAYRSTYEGGSSREDYYLCSDGRFLQSTGTSDFASAPGVSVFGQSSQRGTGRWRIQLIEGEPAILFDYPDGSQETARLEDKKGKTLLNGSRYFVVENDQCD